eukprot:snap_masked-scaffold_5-processed-gene-15.34-mRNA-1 protein AED:0.05 eAED:0.08 QI:0/-1/0/1/-1/1/1/0/469
MNFYFETAKVLKLYETSPKSTSLKSVLYKTNIPNKPQALGFLNAFLKRRTSILSALQCEPLQPLTKQAANKTLLALLIYEKIYGKGIKGGGKLKRLINHYDNPLRENLPKETDEKPQTQFLDDEDRKKNIIWARVNKCISTTENITSILSGTGYEFAEDDHIPSLFKLNLNKVQRKNFIVSKLVSENQVIIQNKASCFPAELLYSFIRNNSNLFTRLSQLNIIDATASPGNKTSQLSSNFIRQNNSISSTLPKTRIFAFDKDKTRFSTLVKRMKQSNCSNVSCFHKDFLSVNPNQPPFNNTHAILLDPSCSGSGFRIDEEEISMERLRKLSSFQLKIIQHAMKFPNVVLISYSTCSVHVEENEEVVGKVLEENKDFTLLKTDFGKNVWKTRGMKGTRLAECETEKVIRVQNKLKQEEGTIGFFVAVFVRKEYKKFLERVLSENKNRKSNKRKKKKKQNNIILSKKTKFL